ncbi:MAG: hypothetical protein COS99_08705 [Candidatus Omnitrophica bacterium CG07_land_8_20_14_0_80_42_15]|uniref:Uncharacterized protein n=1 Tax=Candidatus Aquitaenariimonas noxiae TaxID=1974741 RepID=A0A2J0KSM6_9BACT|nr:MAG: hypothetical protein COS99_08705 [Candidatus Omnitrophica bacterium CG07_land_8_20_14_0_80_42_15]
MNNVKTKLVIPKKLQQNWIINKHNILNTSMAQGIPIFKFSYQPDSGQFLFAEAPMRHNIMIKVYGNHTFDEYIRGIYFKEKKIVYLRGHEREDWLKGTKKMLRSHGVPKTIKIVWGEKVARKLAADLEGL